MTQTGGGTRAHVRLPNGQRCHRRSIPSARKAHSIVSTPNNQPPKRGAPRPLRQDEVQAPPYFSELQLQCWREAVSTRPGFWCAADLVSLEAWAVAAAFIRSAHMSVEEVTPKAYANALRVLAVQGRVLRLCAYDRADDGMRTAPPLHGGEPGGFENVPQGPAPWQRASAGTPHPSHHLDS